MMASWPQAGLVVVVVQRRQQVLGRTVGSWRLCAGWRLLGLLVLVLVLRLRGLLQQPQGLPEQQHHRCHQLLGLHLIPLGGDSPPCTPSSADVVAVGRRRVVDS